VNDVESGRRGENQRAGQTAHMLGERLSSAQVGIGESDGVQDRGQTRKPLATQAKIAADM